jgi:hypothetical protein
LYRQAGFKPYIIGAMIFLSRVKNSRETLEVLSGAKKKRFNG